MNNCPFLSNSEEKIPCFKECAFYEFEGTNEGCPFKKVRGNRTLKLQDILRFELEKDIEEEYLGSILIKDYP